MHFDVNRTDIPSSYSSLRPCTLYLLHQEHSSLQLQDCLIVVEQQTFYFLKKKNHLQPFLGTVWFLSKYCVHHEIQSTFLSLTCLKIILSKRGNEEALNGDRNTDKREYQGGKERRE